MPVLGNRIWNQIQLSVSVNKSEGGSRDGNVRQFIALAIREILDHIGQEL